MLLGNYNVKIISELLKTDKIFHYFDIIKAWSFKKKKEDNFVDIERQNLNQSSVCQKDIVLASETFLKHISHPMKYFSCMNTCCPHVLKKCPCIIFSSMYNYTKSPINSPLCIFLVLGGLSVLNRILVKEMINSLVLAYVCHFYARYCSIIIYFSHLLHDIELKAEVMYIPPDDTFTAERKTCHLLG